MIDNLHQFSDFENFTFTTLEKEDDGEENGSGEFHRSRRWAMGNSSFFRKFREQFNWLRDKLTGNPAPITGRVSCQSYRALFESLGGIMQELKHQDDNIGGPVDITGGVLWTTGDVLAFSYYRHFKWL